MIHVSILSTEFNETYILFDLTKIHTKDPAMGTSTSSEQFSNCSLELLSSKKSVFRSRNFGNFQVIKWR